MGNPFDPNSNEYWSGLVNFAYDHNKFGLLEDKLREAVGMGYWNREVALSVLGKLEERKGCFTEAIRYYRGALEITTDNFQSRELKNDVKRAQYKRLKKLLIKWQR